ncbi:MAG: DUF928 domain-containing protein [Leptolyngbyaceae cyanobacterium bins.302]|nr:DUF928 domain-containing protein [Leptolyngbyaceae cyanobacterium bins.302]
MMPRRIKFLRIWLIAMTGVALVGVPLIAIAQQYTPPRRNLPGRRESAKTRFLGDTCLVGQKPLTALIPPNNFGTTTGKTLMLLWYVPDTKAKTAEVRLVDQADRSLYTTTIPLDNVPGIVTVQLPDRVATQMELNKAYQWQFSLTCTPNDPSKNPFVEGVVQRIPIEPSLSRALKAASNPRDRATVYAKASVWHDAIATLATQRCLNPGDATLQTSWKTLLQSVQLETFADAPLTKCGAIGKGE